MLHVAKRSSSAFLTLSCLAGLLLCLLASSRTVSAHTVATSQGFSGVPLSVYSNPGDHSLYALNPSNGAVRWQFSATGYLIRTPSDSHGTLYLGSTDGKMYALRKSDGTVAWTALVKGEVTTQVALGNNGNIYFGTESGSGPSTRDFLYALNSTTGAFVWRHDFSLHGLDIDNPFPVANNVVYINSNGLEALNASNGRLIWHQTGSPGYYTNNPTLINGVLYATYSPNNFNVNSVCALRPSDGSKIWCSQFSKASNEEVIATPVVANGVVYIGGSYDGHVYALNAMNGSLLWSYRTVQIPNRPRVSGGQVYVTDGFAVYAINASDGSQAWIYVPPQSESTPQGRPAIAGSLMYINGFGSHNYTMALNISNGSRAWLFAITDGAILAPQASPLVA